MGNMIELKAADGHTFAAYVAQPSGKAKGAVVVLQEIFGVNAHIQEVADGYAQAGYVAVAPATFDRQQRGVNLGYKPEDMSAGFALKTAIEALPAPGVIADIKAAVEQLFDVRVVGVSTMNPPRRSRRVGRFAGKRAQVKKAVVRLAEGNAIQLFPES